MGETLNNELGVFVVVGEDNGLANLLATIDHLAAGHQMREHLVHGVDVENVVEYLAGGNVPGRRGLLIEKERPLGHLVFPDVLHLLLLLVGKVLVADAFLHYLGGLGEPGGRDEIIFIDCLAKFVGEVRFAALQAKEVIGAAVHIFTRCGSKTDHQGVEVVQNGHILTKYAAVCLIDDNQIETTDREALVFLVDVVDHRLVGREDNAGVEVRFLRLVEDSRRKGRQMFNEVLVGLIDQRGAVCQEENILDPIVAGKNVHQRDGYTGLAGTSSHHQEATAMHLVEVVADAVNGHLLVVTVSDVIVDTEVCDAATTAMLDDEVKIFFGMESVERPSRITETVNDEGLESVGVIDDRTDAILCLQAICIEFCLVFADGRVFHRSLGLNDCKRLSVCAEENIVHIANTMLIGHSGHLNLDAGLAGHNLSLDIQDIPTGIL